MRAQETISRLASFQRRGAGTDAERRAAGWLAQELSSSGLQVRLEPFWCRPNWALAHAWHCALALVGSLAAVGDARLGGSLLLAALVFVTADVLLGLSPGRRLTPEHASQNVVAQAPSAPAPRRGQMRLILTANYDTGRAGVVHRQRLRRAAAWLRKASGGMSPGWVGWLVIVIGWLMAIAILRLEGRHGTAVGAAQVPPTIALVLAVALLLDQASAGWSPGAEDNASGAAVALSLARALSAAPPRHLLVEVVLCGAGDGWGIGFRRHLRARKPELQPSNSVVVGLAPSGAGDPRWWVSDGQLVPLRYLKTLRELCEASAQESGARGHHGRGAAPAFPARLARLPSISIGCLDELGLAPRSHQLRDLAEAIEPGPLDSAVQMGLLLVDGIDSWLARRQERPAARERTEAAGN